MRISDWSSDVCSSDLAVAPILRSRTSSRSAIATPSLQAGSAVQQPVDHQVDADREGGDGRPGDERGRNAENDAVLVVLHDAAPVGLRRLDAEAEEGERREEQHRESEAQAELSEQRREGIGQDLAKDDPQATLAAQPRGLDELQDRKSTRLNSSN